MSIERAAPEHGSALLPIEQPEQVTGKVWFFCRGISHSGAKYGVGLCIEEVKNRLTAKAGAGQLIEMDGTWFWMPNDQAAEREVAQHPKT